MDASNPLDLNVGRVQAELMLAGIHIRLKVSDMPVGSTNSEELSKRVWDPGEAAYEGEPLSQDGLVDGAEIARKLCVSRDWVYRHARELGAIKLGSGPRAPLRFDPAVVERWLSNRRLEILAETQPRTTSRGIRRSKGVKLLPIRGE